MEIRLEGPLEMRTQEVGEGRQRVTIWLAGRARVTLDVDSRNDGATLRVRGVDGRDHDVRLDLTPPPLL